MSKMYNRNNFHKHTYCVFNPADIASIAHLTADYISKSGSAYYFTQDGVYRLSNHWGRAANCKWKLNGKSQNQRRQLGFAFWSDFHEDNDTEKLYFIEVNFEENTATYKHKSYLILNSEVQLHTSPQVKKLLRQIRTLLTTTAWAKHYTLEIRELRKIIISELLHTNKSLHAIKSEL